MRGRAVLLLAALATLLVGAGARAQEKQHKLIVLFTNDVHGYIEPCG